jgi:hypothetical protein
MMLRMNKKSVAINKLEKNKLLIKLNVITLNKVFYKPLNN